MFDNGEFLAIDWGTTNRRIYKFDGLGNVEQSIRDDRGIRALEGTSFPSEMRTIRERFGNLPAICAGMVGSDRGWEPVPYVSVPCRAGDLTSGVVWVEPGQTAIVPGVAVHAQDRTDVMRGEEVQLLGAIAAGLAKPDALLCQPGTHCKWATMEDGAIADFRTSMTGELFALLVEHSLLASLGNGAAQPNADFLAGVECSRDGDLLSRMFGIRADRVSGRNAIADSHSYLSGLIIGSDIRAAIGSLDVPIYILAGPELGNLYTAALNAIGSSAVLLDSHVCFAAGIQEIVRCL